MRRAVGVVREVYSKWERRAPLTPAQCATLVSKHNCEVLVQPSTKRVFADHEYAAAGATLTDDLSPASAILGVKQVPVDALLPDKTYVFFSHTIKAQPENMELLDACLSSNVRLIDYECVRAGGEAAAPRLIAFGEFAGKSGMVNAFRGVGARLLALGHSSPFLSIGPTYSYPAYGAACASLAAVGEQIRAGGLPAEHAPLVVGIAGGGNVSRGVQDAFEALGEGVATYVQPSELAALSAKVGTTGEHQHRVYGCIIPTDYMVQPHGASRHVAFDELEYFARPEGCAAA
jgi:alpha-aminoadipic semialdehyde synthase